MKKLFKSGADHAFAKYGAARNSHPEDYALLKRRIESLGGKIVWQSGEYGYSPGSSNDFETIAGHIVLDPNASWSVMLHEAQHFFDDYANGYPNFGFYFDGNSLEFWRMEFRGYAAEIKLARKNRDFDLARKIIIDMRERREELRGF